MLLLICMAYMLRLRLWFQVYNNSLDSFSVTEQREQLFQVITREVNKCLPIHSIRFNGSYYVLSNVLLVFQPIAAFCHCTAFGSRNFP